MATQAQIEAARRNGARSKGPVTDSGKANSARNSTTHGLTAKGIFVLVNECSEAFDDLVAGFVRHYQPANELEHELCLNIAHAHWRIRRLNIIETGMFDRQIERQANELGSPGEGIRLAAAFEAMAKDNGALGLVARYEGRLYRTFNMLTERLETMQRARLSGSAQSCNAPDADANAAPSVEIEPVSHHENQSDSPAAQQDLSKRTRQVVEITSNAAAVPRPVAPPNPAERIPNEPNSREAML